jgi:hypothetical protein
MGGVVSARTGQGLCVMWGMRFVVANGTKGEVTGGWGCGRVVVIQVSTEREVSEGG